MHPKIDNVAMDTNLIQTMLLQEHQRVCDDIRSIESSGDKIISIFLVILGAGLTFGIEKNIGYIFALVPIAILSVLFYSIMMYVWVFSLGGYKLHLEEVLNEIAGKNILLWERIVPIRQTLNLASKVLISIYVLVCGAISAVSVYKIFSIYGQVAGHVFSAILIIGFVTLAFCWKKRDAVLQFTYLEARKLYKHPPYSTSIIPTRTTEEDDIFP